MPDDDDIERDEADLFEMVALLKQEKEEADQRFRNAQALLVDHLRAKGRKSASHNGKRFTLVMTERLVIDEAGLKKGLGAALWKKVSVSKLDRKLLDLAMKDGLVDPVVVVKHSTVTPDTPHVRITDVKE